MKKAFLGTEISGEAFQSLWTDMENLDQSILDYFGEILDMVVDDERTFLMQLGGDCSVNTYNAALFSIASMRRVSDKVAMRGSERGNFIVVGPKSMVPGPVSKLFASDEVSVEVPTEGNAVVWVIDHPVDFSISVMAHPPFLQLRCIHGGAEGFEAYKSGERHGASIGAHELRTRLDAGKYTVVVENPTSQPVEALCTWELYREEKGE